MNKMTDREFKELLHAACTGHLALSSIGNEDLPYTLTRSSELTVKSQPFMPERRQRNYNITVRGKSGDGMKIIPK